ncbi:MAG: formate dehydrogenase subunit delta [Burkholderiales bacterium]
MNIEHLIHMANQIGEFFEGEPDQEAAASAVASHLKRFWDPRMRREILRYAEDRGGQGLKDIVIRAIQLNHDSLILAASSKREN